MDNIESKIESILSDPDAMKQIEALSRSLGLADAPPSPAPKPQIENEKKFDLYALTSMLSPRNNEQSTPDTDILKAVTKFLPLIKNMNEEDETTALLCALSPFLSAQKQKRLEDAKKMLRILKMLPFIKSQGLF